MRRLLVRTAVLLGLLAGLVPASASSASTPLVLGQAATSSTGSCGLCNVLQFESSSAPHTYTIPSDGVLTKFRIYVGSEVNPADKVQLRTFHKVSPTSATVTSAGSQHSLSAATPGAGNSFLDRVPAKAGDVLGARFAITASSINATPPSFSTASSADKFGFLLGSSADPGVGESFSPSFSSSFRANVEAWLEPDADQDGYGDISQDLCSGSPVATDACTGSLFGSRLQSEPAFHGACGYACLRVQKAVNGTSTAAPYDGVVVRWRVLDATAGNYAIRVLDPAGGTKYTILRSSPTETIGSEGQLGLSVFSSRLPIPAGGYVALAPPPFAGPQDIIAAPGSTWQQPDDEPEGSTSDFTGWGGATGEVPYDADIEPDADHDGYGDVSQDSCPRSAAVHEGACPPEPPPGVPLPPTITHFAASPKRFHVKPLGTTAAHRSRAGKGGTKLKLTLSEAAKVVFSIESKVSCKKVNAAPRCKPGFRSVTSFPRQLAVGSDAVAYSGLYRRHGRVQPLKPGPYRVTAVATDAAGASSSPARTQFTVLSASARRSASPPPASSSLDG